MKIPSNLTLEQQFKLKVYQDQVKSMSKQEAQECLLEVLRQMMVKDNLVKQLLKNA
ncbi:MAG: NblA/ycf18 family protein [Hormoscilla sp. GUM202]|nr:NblA/ycf18 family protein [Hormoscilla sp. GM7CHS1pb]MBO1348176.1 NblA/ycf18 family protein [Hormoscilla sp. GUM202]